MNTERSSESVRKARRELHAKVRTDWDAVLAQALAPSSPSRSASVDSPIENRSPTTASEPTFASANVDGWRHPFRRRTTKLGNTDSTPSTPPSAASVAAEALEWRERTYASSDPSSDEDSAGEQPRRFSCTRRASLKSPSQAQPNTQDSMPATASPGISDERKRQDRKCRRRQRLEDEMAVNPGLRYWEQRRDIWCLAQSFPVAAEPQPRLSLPEIQPLDLDMSSSSLESTSPTNSNSSSSSLQSSESSAVAAADTASQPTLSHPDDTKDDPQPPDNTDLSPSEGSEPPPTQQLSHDTQQLLPVGRPLLPPSDPTRQIINPSAYPSIYNKLVTQSVAPSIPINLSHIVPALVQGWKDNGEWPPRNSPSTTAAQHTSATGASAVVKKSQQLARAVSNSSSVMRKLSIVEGAKGKSRRLLGQALVRGASGAVAEPPLLDTSTTAAAQTNGALQHSNTTPRGSVTPTAATQTAAEKEGSGASAGENAGATSPRRMHRSVVKVGRALRDGLSGGSSSPSPTSVNGSGGAPGDGGPDNAEARIVVEM